MSDSVRPHRRQPTRLPHPWDSPGKNTGVSCHFLLQCTLACCVTSVVCNSVRSHRRQPTRLLCPHSGGRDVVKDPSCPAALPSCRDQTLKLVISVLSFSSGVLMQLEKLTGLQTPGPGAARRLGEDCPVCSFHLWVIPAPAVRECEDAELPPAVEA